MFDVTVDSRRATLLVVSGRDTRRGLRMSSDLRLRARLFPTEVRLCMCMLVGNANDEFRLHEYMTHVLLSQHEPCRHTSIWSFNAVSSFCERRCLKNCMYTWIAGALAVIHLLAGARLQHYRPLVARGMHMS